jgi:cell division protein FtsB
MVRSPLLFAVLIILFSHSYSEAQNQQPTYAGLQAEVERLRRQVAELERLVADLTQRLAAVKLEADLTELKCAPNLGQLR